MTRGLWRAAAASRGGPSTSTQSIASARRVLNPLSATQSLNLFSTSTRVAKQDDEGKTAEGKKQADNEAAGEAMGATEKAEGGGAVEELQKTLKEKDVKIKELTVSRYPLYLSKYAMYMNRLLIPSCNPGCCTIWKG